MLLKLLRALSTLFCFILVMFTAEASVAQLNKFSSHLFPVPETLKPNVIFWQNVYAWYSERDVIIHDAEDLSVVYTVVNLDSVFKGIQVSSRLEWKKVEAIKKEYQALLLKLSRQRDLSFKNMTAMERRVAEQFGSDLDSKRLRRAAGNIRAQSGLKERFKLGLERSGLYLDAMRDIFISERLPLELLALPHVESSFNYMAYSKLGAAGMWQFTRSTGRNYLKIDYSIDERLDPIRATEAAAKLLKRNFEELGTWPLAITAYNHGRAGMVRAKRKHGTDLGDIVQNYKSRSFGFASRNFYAEFLAALNVAKNYKFYFGKIDFYKPQKYHTFEISDFITVSTLLNKFKIEYDEFVELNPALRGPVLQSKRRIPAYSKIRVPQKEGVDYATLYAAISPQLKYDRQVQPKWHKVSHGENLTLIAHKYRVSMSDLMALNNIRNAHRIYVGQNLQLPLDQAPESRSVVAIAKKKEEPVQLADAGRADADKTMFDISPDIRIAPVRKKAESVSDKINNPESLQVKSWPVVKTADQYRRTLKPINLSPPPNDQESVADVMAMALPGHDVQITRDMGVRVVQTEVIDGADLQDFFRDIAFPENGKVMVEPGESFGHFADWLKVPTWRLRALNRMSATRSIQVGQSILLTFRNVTPEEFHSRRVEYHQGIEEDFYRNFKVVGEKTYEIESGDNIWQICNRKYEVPYWLVKKYNPNEDLFTLRIGEEIIVPLVEEQNVSAESAQ